jgi:hypothetical protein
MLKCSNKRQRKLSIRKKFRFKSVTLKHCHSKIIPLIMLFKLLVYVQLIIQVRCVFFLYTNGDYFVTICLLKKVKALNEMSRVVKPTGNVILLEHGSSKFMLITRYLNYTAPRHYRLWGCRHNKDIAQLIGESNLEVVKKETLHYGTTHHYVCKKKDPTQIHTYKKTKQN